MIRFSRYLKKPGLNKNYFNWSQDQNLYNYMKRILAISGIVFLALAARAQSPGGQNNLSDSTHRHAYRNQWQRRDGENFRHGQDGYNRDRNMAYNHRRGTRRFHSHRGPRIHYTPAQRKQMM